MKKLLILILASWTMAYGQSSTQTLGNATNKVEIKGWGQVDSVLTVPRYTDTSSANKYGNFVDTCGKIIYTYSDKNVWKRDCAPNKWSLLGAAILDTVNIYTTHTYGDNRYVQIQTLPPTASLSGGGVYELHSAGTFAGTLSWSGGRQAAGVGTNPTANLTSIVVAGISQSFSNPSAGSSVSGTQGVTVTWNSNITYTNTVTTSDGKTASATTSFNFLPNRYWGYSSGTPVSADLLAALGGGQELSNSIAKGTFNIVVTGSTKKVFYAYPASEGALSSIIISGLESIGAFTQSTISVTNASGYVQNYFVYTSNNTFSNTTISFNSTN